MEFFTDMMPYVTYPPEELGETLDDFYLLFLNKYDDVIVLVVKLLLVGLGCTFELEKRILQPHVNFDYDEALFKHFMNVFCKLFGCTFLIDYANGSAAMFSGVKDEAKIKLGSGKPIPIKIDNDDAINIVYDVEFFKSRGFDIEHSLIDHTHHNTQQVTDRGSEPERVSMFNGQKDVPVPTKESIGEYLKKAMQEHTDSPVMKKYDSQHYHGDFMEDNYLSNHNIYDPLNVYRSELDNKKAVQETLPHMKGITLSPAFEFESISKGDKPSIGSTSNTVTIKPPPELQPTHAYPHSALIVPLDTQNVTDPSSYPKQLDLSNYYSNEVGPLPNDRNSNVRVPTDYNTPVQAPHLPFDSSKAPHSDKVLENLPHLASQGNALSQAILTDSEDSSEEKHRRKPIMEEEENSIIIKHDLNEKNIDFFKDSFLEDHPSLTNSTNIKPVKNLDSNTANLGLLYMQNNQTQPNSEPLPAKPKPSTTNQDDQTSPEKQYMKLGDHIKNLIDSPQIEDDFFLENSDYVDVHKISVTPEDVKGNFSRENMQSSHAGIADTFQPPKQGIATLESGFSASLMMQGEAIHSHPLSAYQTFGGDKSNNEAPSPAKTNPLLQGLNLPNSNKTSPTVDDNRLQSPTKRKTDLRLSEKVSQIEAKKRPTASVELLNQISHTWLKRLEAGTDSSSLKADAGAGGANPAPTQVSHISNFNNTSAQKKVDLTPIEERHPISKEELIPEVEGPTRKKLFLQSSDSEKPCRSCSKVEKLTKMYYYDRSFFCEQCYSVVSKRIKSKGMQNCSGCNERAERIMVVKFIMTNKLVRNEGSLLFTREKKVDLYYSYMNRYSSMPLKPMQLEKVLLLISNNIITPVSSFAEIKICMRCMNTLFDKCSVCKFLLHNNELFKVDKCQHSYCLDCLSLIFLKKYKLKQCFTCKGSFCWHKTDLENVLHYLLNKLEVLQAEYTKNTALQRQVFLEDHPQH